jgi:hypothetical protein
VGDTTFIRRPERKINFTIVNVSSQCPLVLLAKVGWRHGTALRSEGGKVITI